jgi:hypothetical protein
MRIRTDPATFAAAVLLVMAVAIDSAADFVWHAVTCASAHHGRRGGRLCGGGQGRRRSVAGPLRGNDFRQNQSRCRRERGQ